jgi:hypothetical protein
MMLTIINQTILRAPFQTIHNSILYTRYLSKSSTFAICMSVPTTTQTILWAPFQTIHNPNPYTRYLSKLSTSLCRTSGTNHSIFRTPGTFPIQVPSQSVHKVPCQAIHNPNPCARYQAKPLQANSHLVRWKTTTRHKIPRDNSTSRKMEGLLEDPSYIKINDSTTNL